MGSVLQTSRLGGGEGSVAAGEDVQVYKVRS